MRTLRTVALLLFAVTPLAAQRQDTTVRPSLAPLPYHTHPRLDRSEYLVPRTTIAGAVIGALAGALQPVPANASRETRMEMGLAIGAGFGMMAGHLGSVVNFRPPPRRVRQQFDRIPSVTTPFRDFGRYVNAGGQLGSGLGMLYAMQLGYGRSDDDIGLALSQLGSVLLGFVGGMAAGALTFLLQH